MLILPIGSMHDDGQNQAERVHGQVPFSTGNLLVGIVSPLLPTFGRADGLTVDDGHGRGWFLAGPSPGLLSQSVVKLLPEPLVSPLPKDAVDRAPIGETGGQHTPLATGTYDIENGVDDPTPTDRSPAPTMHWREVMPNNLPLAIRQVTGIIPSNFHATAPACGWSQKIGAVALFFNLRNFKTRSEKTMGFQLGEAKSEATGAGILAISAESSQ